MTAETAAPEIDGFALHGRGQRHHVRALKRAHGFVVVDTKDNLRVVAGPDRSREVAVTACDQLNAENGDLR